MNGKQALFWLVIMGVAAALGSSCSSNDEPAPARDSGAGAAGSPSTGDGSPRDSGAGGVRDGAVACEESGGAPVEYHSCNCANTGGYCTAAGGAIGYPNCSNFIASGIDSFSCPQEGGPPKRSVLADFCERMAEVGQMFDQTIVFGCATKFGTPTTSKPDAAIADAHFDYFSAYFTFDEKTVCDPGLADKLRACTVKIVPCPRPPICIPGGDFGCDDIVASCPAITMDACRRGFDSRNHDGRERIRQCLASDAGDCVAAFYRCAWGL